ncbi:MAG: YraN family protein [Candidatus Limivicinus sp.]|jgi:putative endonuclease
MNKSSLGKYGERVAAEFLSRNGYKIIDMNYSCRFGEIDVIAARENFIVFAEVKLRKNSNFAEAREFVTYSKQQRIIKTALIWLEENDCCLQPRFDVIEIYAPNGAEGDFKLNHIENAFM